MSNSKTKRMKRIFAMQSRKEERHRVAVAAARHRVDVANDAVAAAEAQTAELAQQKRPAGGDDVSTVRFGRLLIETAMAASAHRRVELETALADLEDDYEAWQVERQRAKSFEKVVDRLVEADRVEAAKADEALIEELSLSRWATSDV